MVHMCHDFRRLQQVSLPGTAIVNWAVQLNASNQSTPCHTNPKRSTTSCSIAQHSTAWHAQVVRFNHNPKPCCMITFITANTPSHAFPHRVARLSSPRQQSSSTSDAPGAADAAVAAFRADQQDRYSNSVASKRMFQAGRLVEAEAAAITFTRDSEAHNNLFDMQVAPEGGGGAWMGLVVRLATNCN